ncbi:LysR substrate-binding domain-containing protein [Commensalibacter nepenthis]|uniref:LysR substrate-binding domain-containing protein n=1 Tax=Commensalibacter nepenthis TaxID=3043872 RepID=A0ABT6Q6L4_9PROT|nr:LysR substrate-binding domain-containing protein [Commensalibacter sp. TBRC 10068]MDI2112531.1 LysR substrate-binding domain-containing protein [Commensalibacter sp. TBRC 10068]
MNRSYWKFGKHGENNVYGSFTVNNGEILRNAAMMGQGIAYLPKFLLNQELVNKQLIPLNLNHPTIQNAGLYIMYPPSDYVPLKSRVMIDYLVQQFSQKASWD